MPLPPPLTPASRVAVVWPASAPLDAAGYAEGVAALRARGLTVDAPPPPTPYGYLAAPDADRLAELNAGLRHPHLAALFVGRGGYGSMRLLPHLDYRAARRHPKLLVGYSDITALHFALWKKARLPGLSGPMVAPDWSALHRLPGGEAAEAQFWQLAGGAAPLDLAGPEGEPLRPLQAGHAEGVLLGGNLAMIAALLGTPFFPDLRGAILFLEDVGEPPYRIDRLLMQLDLAGVLPRLGGLVFGAFTGADPLPNRPSLPLAEVLLTYAARVPGPVAQGLVYGHFPVKTTMPVGVRARLSVVETHATLAVLEPVVGVR